MFCSLLTYQGSGFQKPSVRVFSDAADVGSTLTSNVLMSQTICQEVPQSNTEQPRAGQFTSGHFSESSLCSPSPLLQFQGKRDVWGSPALGWRSLEASGYPSCSHQRHGDRVEREFLRCLLTCARVNPRPSRCIIAFSFLVAVYAH